MAEADKTNLNIDSIISRLLEGNDGERKPDPVGRDDLSSMAVVCVYMSVCVCVCVLCAQLWR